MSQSDHSTARECFLRTMSYSKPERLPYFEEGIREDVLHAWRKQGLPKDADPSQLFPADPRLELQPEIFPIPEPPVYPSTRDELEAFIASLDPNDQRRLPADWLTHIADLRRSGGVLMLRLHRGFFQTMGVGGWERFAQVCAMLIEQPDFVAAYLKAYGEFTAQLAKNVLEHTSIDAAVFSEPIGGNHGPLISPQMYERIVLPSYEPLFELLRSHHVEVIIFRTYANARALLAPALNFGFNTLWACEVPPDVMDYNVLRKQFGRRLRFIGGIDLDALRLGKEAIKKEIERLTPLAQDGGYIPLADGRVRADVPYEHYRYYRQLLHELTHHPV